MLQSYGGMTVMLSFFTQAEQLLLQVVNKQMYDVAIGRVQIRIKLTRRLFFTCCNSIGELFPHFIYYVAGQAPKYVSFEGKEGFTNRYWNTCQVGYMSLFQVKSASLECRLLRINTNLNTFKVEKRANASQKISGQCLLHVNNQSIFSIGGIEGENTFLSTVFSY